MKTDLENPMLALTGGLACGKSETGRILEKMGFAVLDADVVAHDLTRKGRSVFHGIVDRFGEVVVGRDGELDRGALGAVVFDDPTELDALNRLTHPAIRERIKEWIAKNRVQRQKAAALIPLLFESGMETLDFDAVICVSSPLEDVIRRLGERGFDPNEAKKRINAQAPLADKERWADLVIMNQGSLRALEEATRNVVDAVVKGTYERRKRSG